MTITVADLCAWLDTPTPAPASELEVAMQLVIDATTANIARHHTTPDDPTEADWVLAHTMQAARWWKRRASPEGIIGMDELGAIRVSRRDSDVDTLLAPFTAWGFA